MIADTINYKKLFFCDNTGGYNWQVAEYIFNREKKICIDNDYSLSKVTPTHFNRLELYPIKPDNTVIATVNESCLFFENTQSIIDINKKNMLTIINNDIGSYIQIENIKKEGFLNLIKDLNSYFIIHNQNIKLKFIAINLHRNGLIHLKNIKTNPFNEKRVSIISEPFTSTHINNNDIFAINTLTGRMIKINEYYLDIIKQGFTVKISIDFNKEFDFLVKSGIFRLVY
ncbi:hypothetical protein [Photorhabdus kayaii]|uniref:hypothetical protein n=1 Tax=Photorhabdus kayaii TaxID=230088 RepID=UPI0021D5102B|nr:hypothetical protein [Photorhabdus kayaii]MCT8353173.1 hypothetical protein [Photorhabdus kayaii]